MGIVHLVRMVILQLHLRYAVAGQVPELVINVARRIINIVVAERVTHPEAERLVTVNIRLVTVRVGILGMVAVVWRVVRIQAVKSGIFFTQIRHAVKII